MNFQAIVPTAGIGKRLRPLTLTTPKVMLEVAGKPVIGHIMDRLLLTKPSAVCVVLAPHDRQTRPYLRRNYRCRFRFVIQHRPLGLAHAVYQARDYFRGEPALILLGDTILDFDLSRIVSGPDALGVKRVKDPRRFGVVELKHGLISRIVEKPKRPRSNLALVGLYYLRDSERLFRALAELLRKGRKLNGEFPFTDTLQQLANSGTKIRPVKIDHWLDCGTPAAFLETNRYLLRQRSHFRPRQGCRIVPPVFIADSARVENSIIGPNVALGEGVQVRDAIIRDAIVNRNVVLERAVIEKAILGVGRHGQLLSVPV